MPWREQGDTMHVDTLYIGMGVEVWVWDARRWCQVSFPLLPSSSARICGRVSEAVLGWWVSYGVAKYRLGGLGYRCGMAFALCPMVAVYTVYFMWE